MDSARYAQLFLTESRDNLTAVNQALLELERKPDEPGHLDALFRAVHTIKGMSGVMGYAVVADLAHDVEALLASVRSGEHALVADDLELLFTAADSLERAVEQAVSGQGEPEDAAHIIRRLRLAVGEGAAHVAARRDSTDLPPGSGVAVRVTLVGDAPLKGARALLVLQAARALGALMMVAPDEQTIATDGFGGTFAFRLDTPSTDGEIEHALRSAGYVDRVEVTRGQATGASRPGGEAGAQGRAVSAQRYVRIDLERLDELMNLAGELIIARGRLARLASTHADPDLDDAVAHTSRLVGEVQDGILASRMVPVWQVFDRFPRLVRDSARELGKEIEFAVDGRDIELDRALLDQLSDPLMHLLRNSIDHGLELPHERVAAGKPRAGRLVVSASRDRSAIVIRITDDGRGIDRAAVLRRARAEGLVDAEREELTDDEVLRFISRAGFSTVTKVTSLSGRGVGIDAVVTRVRALGGSIELRSVPGQGTGFTLRLPVTLTVIPALMARVAGETYALPLTHVRETLQLHAGAAQTLRGRPVLLLREEVLRLKSLREIVGLKPRDEGGGQVVVLEVADRRAGLVVDQLIGQEDVVVKGFDAVRGAHGCFSGATILPDGTPALIIEVSSLL